MPTLYDTHAHLSDPGFEAELPQLLERARVAGVEKIVTIATDFQTSARAIQIAELYPQVYAVVGWHPSDASKAPDDLRPTLRQMAEHPKVLALGETGLDYHWLPSRATGGTADDDARDKHKQADLFRQHLEVAAELGLNCVVHERDALEDTLALFEPFASRVRAVFHCFARDPAVLRHILELGSVVSFTGILTFKNGQNIREALAAAPLGSFMLETDSPFLAPVPHRGRRCEPSFLPVTAAMAAQVKGCSPEELSAATCATAREFFHF
jgi:TatD DNase family protein